MVGSPHNPIDPEEAIELRRSLVSESGEHAEPDMTRDEALLRLADRLGDDAFASVHLAEVALTNRDVAADLRAGKPARFFREWTVLITAPGYSHNHAGDRLAPVVEQALSDYLSFRAARDAEQWAREAIPDKPPKLVAPGTAEERQQGREKDAAG